VMDEHVKPYSIFEKSGIKIGVFGLGIELDGLVNKPLYKETKYLDPIARAQDISTELKNQNCDLIVCLSHLGYQYNEDKVSDITLAKNTENIDLIIGGHTHTFMEKPVLQTNRQGRKVLINQVGCFGLYLGRIDFYFENSISDSEGISITV